MVANICQTLPWTYQLLYTYQAINTSWQGTLWFMYYNYAYLQKGQLSREMLSKLSKVGIWTLIVVVEYQSPQTLPFTKVPPTTSLIE